MHGIRERRWRYGMEGFLAVLGLLLAELLLGSVWEAFAAVEESCRSAFIILAGIGYFLLRCALGGVSAGNTKAFSLIFSGAAAAAAAWRLAESFWAAASLQARHGAGKVGGR